MTPLVTPTYPIIKDAPDTIHKVVIRNSETDAVVDVSGATISIKFRKPGGAADGTDDVTETASLTGDGTDGVIQFKDTLAAYTDQVGTWKYWGITTIGSDGPTPTSNTNTYEVIAEGAG